MLRPRVEYNPDVAKMLAESARQEGIPKVKILRRALSFELDKCNPPLFDPAYRPFQDWLDSLPKEARKRLRYI